MSMHLESVAHATVTSLVNANRNRRTHLVEIKARKVSSVFLSVSQKVEATQRGSLGAPVLNIGVSATWCTSTPYHSSLKEDQLQIVLGLPILENPLVARTS